MSVNHWSADRLTLVSNSCLSLGLKNSVLFAKVSDPSAAGWNPPDCITQTSAAPHVYTSPPLCPPLSISLPLFPLVTDIKQRGEQRVNTQLGPISRLSYFAFSDFHQDLEKTGFSKREQSLEKTFKVKYLWLKLHISRQNHQLFCLLSFCNGNMWSSMQEMPAQFWESHFPSALNTEKEEVTEHPLKLRCHLKWQLWQVAYIKMW